MPFYFLSRQLNPFNIKSGKKLSDKQKAVLNILRFIDVYIISVILYFLGLLIENIVIILLTLLFFFILNK